MSDALYHYLYERLWIDDKCWIDLVLVRSVHLKIYSISNPIILIINDFEIIYCCGLAKQFIYEIPDNIPDPIIIVDLLYKAFKCEISIRIS